MGVYIKDMEMPKECHKCVVWDYEYGCPLVLNRDDCPLIDIVRCGECEYADEYNHCKYSEWWNGNADFCSHGIRRKEK